MHVFLSSADFFFKKMKKSFRVSDGSDLYQDRRFVGPDLGPNCLHRLHVSANDKSRFKQGRGFRGHMDSYVVTRGVQYVMKTHS